MMRLNLTPAFNLAHAAMPRLLERGGGAFVAVSARPALRPFAGSSAYATRRRRSSLHPGARRRLPHQGLRANAILPSVIDTPANRAAEPDADHSKWVQPDEIARSCASDRGNPERQGDQPAGRAGAEVRRPGAVLGDGAHHCLIARAVGLTRWSARPSRSPRAGPTRVVGVRLRRPVGGCVDHARQDRVARMPLVR